MLIDSNLGLPIRPIRLVVAIAAMSFLCVSVANSADIALRYNKKLASLSFPSPLLQGTIRGQTAWFIIDTGAGVEVLLGVMVYLANYLPAHRAMSVDPTVALRLRSTSNFLDALPPLR